MPLERLSNRDLKKLEIISIFFKCFFAIFYKHTLMQGQRKTLLEIYYILSETPTIMDLKKKIKGIFIYFFLGENLIFLYIYIFAKILLKYLNFNMHREKYIEIFLKSCFFFLNAFGEIFKNIFFLREFQFFKYFLPKFY